MVRPARHQEAAATVRPVLRLELHPAVAVLVRLELRPAAGVLVRPALRLAVAASVLHPAALRPGLRLVASVRPVARPASVRPAALMAHRGCSNPFPASRARV
jgi:hypothetical protein